MVYPFGAFLHQCNAIGVILVDASAYAAEVASVTDALKSELAGELKAGLELRLSKKVRTGFRLCTKDGSGYIDCSDEELAEQLAPFFRELRI